MCLLRPRTPLTHGGLLKGTKNPGSAKVPGFALSGGDYFNFRSSTILQIAMGTGCLPEM